MRTSRLFPRGTRSRSVLMVLLSTLAAACGGDSPTQSPNPLPPVEPLPAVATVEVAPETYIIPIGTHHRFGAAARASDGTLLQKQGFEWSSSDPTIATVDASGNVVAHRAGNAVVTARLEGKQGHAVVQVPVPPPSVVAVEVQGGPVTLRPGQTHKLGAVAWAADGNALGGKDFTWTSSNGAVVVDSTGRVHAVGLGTAVVTATTEGRTGTATVTVQAEGSITTSYQMASIDGVSLGHRYGRIETTTWVDAQGVPHPAETVIVGGVLRVTMQHAASPTYEQEILIATYLLDTPAGAPREPVAERIRHDRGTVAYDWSTGAFVFHSTTYAGQVVPSTRTPAGMNTRQRVGANRPDWTFGWVREE